MSTRTPQSNEVTDLTAYRRRQQLEGEHSTMFSRWGAFVIGVLLMLTIIAFVTMNYLIRSGDSSVENAVKLSSTLERSSTVSQR